MARKAQTSARYNPFCSKNIPDSPKDNEKAALRRPGASMAKGEGACQRGCGRNKWPEATEIQAIGEQLTSRSCLGLSTRLQPDYPANGGNLAGTRARLACRVRGRPSARQGCAASPRISGAR